MGVFVLSLVLSLLALFLTATKVYILTWRSSQKENNVLADTVLSWILLLLNLLLSVFSIRRIETVLELLLSLANGALILYQCMWAWQFAVDYSQRLRQCVAATQVLCVITMCILSPVLPLVLKEGHGAWHVAGLLFFAAEYVLLLVFYGHIFFKSYRKPKHQKHGEEGGRDIRDILVWNMVLSSIALLAAIPSLALYGTGVINFEFSLWIKYTVAALWFLRWVILQYTSKSNKPLWFWRWLQSTATNTDSSMRSFATSDPLRKESSKPPFEPNPDDQQGDSGQGAGYIWSASLPSAVTHESVGEIAGKRTPCTVTATAYIQRWGQKQRKRDQQNMKTEIARKRIHPSHTDTSTKQQDSGQRAAPELAGNGIEFRGGHYSCCCADLDDSGSGPCHICGHLCCFTNIQGFYGSE